jgi:hypothetical protein
MPNNFILFADDGCKVPDRNLSVFSFRWSIIPVNCANGLSKSTMILFRVADVLIRIDIAVTE